jgi:hypothetical protein
MYSNLDMELRTVTSTACRASFDTKRRWLQNYRCPFQHSPFDFVDQINWRAAFYCPNAADHLTADGICIGHKLAQSFIVRPWEAASDAPLTPGTVLRSRLMVPEPRCRKGLLQLTSASAGGLSADDLQQLVTRLRAEGDRKATIAPVLAGFSGRRRRQALGGAAVPPATAVIGHYSACDPADAMCVVAGCP